MTKGISGEKQVIKSSNMSNSVSSLFTYSKRDDDFSTVRVSTSFRTWFNIINIFSKDLLFAVSTSDTPSRK